MAAKSLSVNVQNCSGAGSVTKFLPIVAANCNKTVGLTFKCGIGPWTVKAVLEGTTTQLGLGTFQTNTAQFTYSVPNDGNPHNVVITITDSTGKETGKHLRQNIKCG